LIGKDAYIATLLSGVFAFASTTFLLSMYNINARGVMTPNIILGMAIFAGGLLQFIAGMWQFPRGNVFSATGITPSFPYSSHLISDDICV